MKRQLVSIVTYEKPLESVKKAGKKSTLRSLSNLGQIKSISLIQRTLRTQFMFNF